MNIEIFKKMFLIRLVEESLLDLFSKGYLSGTVHTCIGQEACSVGVISQCDLNKDIFFSNHRGHGHYLSYYNNPKSLIAEIMGKEEGVCQGLGGSQHLQINNFYTPNELINVHGGRSNTLKILSNLNFVLNY